MGTPKAVLFGPFRAHLRAHIEVFSEFTEYKKQPNPAGSDFSSTPKAGLTDRIRPKDPLR